MARPSTEARASRWWPSSGDLSQGFPTAWNVIGDRQGVEVVADGSQGVEVSTEAWNVERQGVEVARLPVTW